MSAKEAVSTLLVNPASGITAAIIYGVMQRNRTSLDAVLNPWGLSPLLWLLGYAFVRLALLGFVDGLVWLLAPRLPPLPSRTGPKPVYQHSINALDLTYLVINSSIEYVFALQIGHLLWHAPFIVRAPLEAGLVHIYWKINTEQ